MMTLYKCTANGIEAFSDEEEAQWNQIQAVYDSNADARAAAGVRAERDKKLAATDWRASVDLTLSTEWANYRQALRDVPSQAGFQIQLLGPVSLSSMNGSRFRFNYDDRRCRGSQR